MEKLKFKYPNNPYKRKKLKNWLYIYTHIMYKEKNNFLKFYVAEIISKGKTNEVPNNRKRDREIKNRWEWLYQMRFTFNAKIDNQLE